MRKGEEVALFRGDGLDYVYRVDRVDAGGLALSVVERVRVATDPLLPMTLLVPMLKGDRVSDVVRGVVPLGVGRVIPFAGRRAVRRPRDKCRERWTTVAEEAVRQCGLTRPAAIHPVCASFAEAVECLRQVTEGKGTGIIFWEGSRRRLEEGLAAARRKVLDGEALWVACAIGPEGGFEPEEVRLAEDAGFMACGLGPRILRSELAAVVAAALLQHCLGDLR